MTSLRAAIVLSVLLWCTSHLQAQTTVGLKLREEQDPRASPYRTASLTIRNESNDVIRAAILRCDKGGPEISVPVLVPAQTTQTVDVPLIIISQQQTYNVRLLEREDGDAPPVASFQSTIESPPQLADPTAFLDPEGYLEWADAPPTWTSETMRNVLLTAVLGCIALIALLFIKAPLPRLVALFGVVAILTGAIGWVLLTESLIIERTVGDGALLLVRSRRTTTWTAQTKDVYPIYRDLYQLKTDEMILRPDRTLKARIKPQRPRLFRLHDKR